MPNHIRQRIASLRELIAAGLHQGNLDEIVADCNALSQDTSHVLSFFVLKKLFAEISAALEGEAVTLERFKDLTFGVAEAAILILDKIENGTQVEVGDLESLVSSHIRNLNVFRSDR